MVAVVVVYLKGAIGIAQVSPRCWNLLVAECTYVIGCYWMLFGCCWVLLGVGCCWMLLDAIGCRIRWMLLELEIACVAGYCWMLSDVVGIAHAGTCWSSKVAVKGMGKDVRGGTGMSTCWAVVSVEKV